MTEKQAKLRKVVVVDEMLDLLHLPDYSERTKSMYLTASRVFLQWCDEAGLHPDVVTAKDLQHFFDHRGLSRSSRFPYIHALSALFKALQENDLCDDNPTSSWMVQYGKKKGKGGPRVANRLPTVLDSEEETRLLASIPMDDSLHFTEYRKRALIHLLLYSGLRVSEALSLRLGQVRLEADPAVLRVIGKGNKEREVPISGTLHATLLAYRERRNEFVLHGDWLFATANGGSMTRTWAYQTVAAALGHIGITNKAAYGPHVLRHTFATRQLRAGVAPSVVKLWMGHSDLTVTLKVYEHVVSTPAGMKPI